MAYDVREGGADEVDVRFLDTETGREVGERLPLARYFGVAVTPDRRTAYYSKRFRKDRESSAAISMAVRRRRSSATATVPTRSSRSAFPRTAVGSLISSTTVPRRKKTDIYLKDLAAAGSVQDGRQRSRCEDGFDFAGDDLIIQTNWNAPNERIMKVGCRRSGPRELAGDRPGKQERGDRGSRASPAGRSTSAISRT